MASKDQLRDEVRRTTLPNLPLPTAVEGAGRLFDWTDSLSAAAYRAVTRPDADSAALASDFAAVGVDLNDCMVVLYLRRDDLERDREGLASALDRAIDRRVALFGEQGFGKTFMLRRWLRKIHPWSAEPAGHKHRDSPS